MNILSIQSILLFTLAALMIAAAVSDLRSRTISNELNAVIALLAVPFWFAADYHWLQIAWQFGAAFAVFTVFAGLFFIGAMGGGDVKMLGGVMLWIPIGMFLDTLMVMALVGGLLSATMLIFKKLRADKNPPEVPYGVAIAAAGLWALHQQYLNHFWVIGTN